jgi:hypothetical protein
MSIALVLPAGVAHAKPWKKWAPDPLDSDSSYAAFLARPSDSLTAAQLSWLAVQRDWRAQREAESGSPSPASITDSGHWHPHPARRTDARFAALASRPYEALADSERAWLVSENTAQQVARSSQGRSSGGAGLLLVGLLIGALAGTWLIAQAMSQSPYTI